MGREQNTSKPARGVEIRKGRNGQLGTLRINIKVPGRDEPLRKALGIAATPSNIRYAENLVSTIRFKIQQGTFDIGEFFPDELQKTSAATVEDLLMDRMERKRQLGLQGSTNGWQLSTYGNRLKRFKNWINPYFGHLTVEQITPEHVRKFLRAAQGVLDAHSAKMTLSLLNPLIEEAIAEGRLSTHPYKHINVGDFLVTKSTAQRKETIDPLSIKEIALVTLSDNNETLTDANLFKFMLMSGVRRQEAPLIKWCNYDPIAAKLHLEEAIGTTDNTEYVKGLKTGESRTIDLLPDAYEAIEAQRKFTYGHSEYIFLNQKTEETYSLKLMYHRWKAACSKSGIRYRSVKQTRHTFISIMLALGENSAWIRHQSGHTNTAMFDLHYAKWIDLGSTSRKSIKLDDLI